MAVSEARIIANRKNAEKSSGPKTPEGKAASRLNGLKHGLRAQLPLAIGDEDPEALERRRVTWASELGPGTEVERYLVEAAVTASWALDRCRRSEAAAL